jgi:allantoinase
MMTIGLHLRTIGRPGRIGGLERVLHHIHEKGGAWIARRRDIARHWREVHGTPAGAPNRR